MNEDLLKALIGLIEDHKKCCDPCDPINDQYKHSLARFNDTSSQTSAAAQQSFAQAMSVHSAHLLRLQADICRFETGTQ